MLYKFKASATYWKRFYALLPAQKESVREKWRIFKNNPFHPSLGTHKIHKLSAAYGKTVHGVTIEGNLRVVFFIEGSTVYTVDIGTHDIYK